MRIDRKQIGAAALLGLVIPWLVLCCAVWLYPKTPDTAEPETEPTQPSEKQEQEQEQMTLLLSDGTKTVVTLDDYLTGVVLAEMPADFETEALKAQAVVARTYTLRRQELGSKHGGMMCTDPACCQGYRQSAEYLDQGGSEADVQRVRRAVTETAGQVLTYEGALIDATYFSCSGGSTEDAAAVWGADIPYLQATPSPGEEMAAHYTDTVTFTRAELEDALQITLSGDFIGAVTETAGGGVDRMELGGETFSGTELRKLLGLRSTAFTMEQDGDTVTVVTRGFGHRVGMSQYGAQAMALAGSAYDEILIHYYTGAVLEEISQ